MSDNAGLNRTLEQLSTEIAERSAKLLDFEERWRDKQSFLESKGYMLRPRYRPGWTPSWRNKPLVDPRNREDAIIPPVSTDNDWSFVSQTQHRFQPILNLMDARRLSDNQLICIKRVLTASHEISIACHLSRDEVRSDPRNHSVPILDTFQDDEDDRISYLVMPFLRPMDNPPFEVVQDVADFVDQILEVRYSETTPPAALTVSRA